MLYKDDRIHVTPLGKLNGRGLYGDMDDVKGGESFKVKLDVEKLDQDILFNSLIIKWFQFQKIYLLTFK